MTLLLVRHMVFANTFKTFTPIIYKQMLTPPPPQTKQQQKRRKKKKSYTNTIEAVVDMDLFSTFENNNRDTNIQHNITPIDSVQAETMP